MNFLNIRQDVKSLLLLALSLMVMWGLTANTSYLVGFPLFFALIGFGVVREARDARVTGETFHPIEKLFASVWWILSQVHIVVLFSAIWILSREFELKNVWLQSGLNMSIGTGNLSQLNRPDNVLSPDSRLSPFIHFWTLSVVLQFLLVLLILGYIVSKVNLELPKFLKRVLVLLLFIGSGCLAYLNPIQLSTESYLSSMSWAWAFLAGVGFAFIDLRLPESKINAIAGDLMFFAALVAVSLHVTGITFVSTNYHYIVLLLVFLPLVLSKNQTLNFKLLSSTFIVRATYVSFGVFIWHWPIAQFVKNLLGTEVLSTVQSIAIIVSSSVLGFISTQFVEYVWNKFGKMSKIKGRSITLATLAVVPMIMLFIQGSSSPTTSPTPNETVSFNPALEVAVKDEPDYLNDSRCSKNSTTCLYGDETSDTHLLLYGSSLSGNWQPALAQIAEEENWKLEVRINPDCPSSKPTKSCKQWLKTTKDYVMSVKPDMVLSNFAVLGQVRVANYNGEAATGGQIGEVTNSEIETWSDFAQSGIRVVVLRGSSSFGLDPIKCLKDEAAAKNCSFSKSRSYFDSSKVRRIMGIAQYKITLLDLTDKFCNQDVCFAADNKGRVVYRDSTHVTKTFSLYLSAVLKEQIVKIISLPVDTRPANCDANDRRPECKETESTNPQPTQSSENVGPNPSQR